MIRSTLGLLLLLAGGAALAQEPRDQDPDQVEIPAPPPMPEQAPPQQQPGEEAPVPEKAPQPDIPPPTVTIRRQEGKLIEEYSVNGHVYMVRVTPKNAPPYYLVDMDGDGELRRSDMEMGPHVLPPHWVLFEWQ